MRSRPSPARRGFTLLELIIAVTLVGVIFAAAIPFFITQGRSVARNAQRYDALQNARFGMNMLEKDLRALGMGVDGGQPMLVQLDPRAVTFNANLVTRSAGDMWAVYVDKDASDNTTRSLPLSRAVDLPLTAPALRYPFATYTDNSGTLEPAETISYYVEPDPTPAAPGDHRLMRRVNDAPAEVVVRSLVMDGQPFFTYLRVAANYDIEPFPPDSLPAVHAVAQHGSVADAGVRSALIDSVRLVRVRLVSRYSDRTGASVRDTLQRTIRLMNMGMTQRTICGAAPGAPTALTAVKTGLAVKLTWSPSGDDNSSGERDVAMYVVYRREPGVTAAFTDVEPYASLVGGQTTYTFTDSKVATGKSYVYAVASQDCSPANSGLATTGTITF